MELDAKTQAEEGWQTPAPPALELRGISKAFGPVQANKNISLSVRPGTIHGIIGENGAGKSTLMSIIFGFYRADSGKILIHGEEKRINDSQAAIAAGIGMVFQHFKLVQNFTVLENVVLGAESGGLLGPSLRKARRALTELAKEYGLEVDPDARIEDIGVGMQQRVEILKALYRRADILILDEPTGVLTPSETDQFFRILNRLREEGKTIILITHKLREIMDITDTVSVMRRGEMTATVKTAETTPERLAEMMVGRKVLLQVAKEPAKPGEEVLRVENLRVVDENGVERLRGIDLTLRRGEILGIAGVAGNGQSELLRVLGGYERATGRVVMNGEELDLTGRRSDGRSRRARGIAHVPEDRQHEGLIMEYHAWENTVFGIHHDAGVSVGPFLLNSKIRRNAADQMERFDVRPLDPALAAKNFSGGNQQKIVVAREIERRPDLLLVGQPTRGVDIGAIEFIHEQIVKLRDSGSAVLLVSVELEEILSLSDRIAVMFDGRVMGERVPSETNEAALGLLMAGLTEEEAAAESFGGDEVESGQLDQGTEEAAVEAEDAPAVEEAVSEVAPVAAPQEAPPPAEAEPEPEAPADVAAEAETPAPEEVRPEVEETPRKTPEETPEEKSESAPAVIPETSAPLKRIQIKPVAPGANSGESGTGQVQVQVNTSTGASEDPKPQPSLKLDPAQRAARDALLNAVQRSGEPGEGQPAVRRPLGQPAPAAPVETDLAPKPSDFPPQVVAPKAAPPKPTHPAQPKVQPKLQPVQITLPDPPKPKAPTGSINISSTPPGGGMFAAPKPKKEEKPDG